MNEIILEMLLEVYHFVKELWIDHCLVKHFDDFNENIEGEIFIDVGVQLTLRLAQVAHESLLRQGTFIERLHPYLDLLRCILSELLE